MDQSLSPFIDEIKKTEVVLSGQNIGRQLILAVSVRCNPDKVKFLHELLPCNYMFILLDSILDRQKYIEYAKRMSDH